MQVLKILLGSIYLIENNKLHFLFVKMYIESIVIDINANPVIRVLPVLG